jgi:hypothetical protein
MRAPYPIIPCEISGPWGLFTLNYSHFIDMRKGKSVPDSDLEKEKGVKLIG